MYPVICGNSIQTRPQTYIKGMFICWKFDPLVLFCYKSFTRLNAGIKFRANVFGWQLGLVMDATPHVYQRSVGLANSITMMEAMITENRRILIRNQSQQLSLSARINGNRRQTIFYKRKTSIERN